ncbi:MAG: DUF721 domain-containing protein [candidate division WOR-3 bacterium]
MSRHSSRRRSQFCQLGAAIPETLRRLGIDRQVAAQRAALDWPKIAGEKLNRHSRALGVEDGVLYIEADSPLWMTELIFLKPKLMTKVKGIVGPELVRDIRILLKR